MHLLPKQSSPFPAHDITTLPATDDFLTRLLKIFSEEQILGFIMYFSFGYFSKRFHEVLSQKPKQWP